MKNQKFKSVLFIFLTILIILFLVILFLNGNLKKVDTVKRVVGLIEKQTSIEKDFEIYEYSFENPNVILDPYDISPLTALVTFITEEPVSVKVTVVGKDNNSTLTHEFDEVTQFHYIPIYGLYPDSKNEIILEMGDSKKTIYIETEALPSDFILPTEVTADKDSLGNEFYFFTPASKGMFPSAFDVNGDLRWYLSEKFSWDNVLLDNGRMLVGTERLINDPYYVTGFYEIDMLGKIYKEYKLPGGYHHDYFEMTNGNLLLASNDFYNSSGTVEDFIVEIDRDSGNFLNTYDLKDILNMDDGKSEGWSATDWFHNNSVWYDEKSNSITLSGRHKDAVINIDYSTGDLNWIIGDPTNWDDEYQKYFFTPIGDDFEWQWSQHAAMVLPNGDIFVLDNGNNKSKIEEDYVLAEDSYTRGVIYRIDTDKMEIEQVWQYGKERGSDFYSPYISDVDYFADGHYLIHSGGISYKDGIVCNYPAAFADADTLKSETVEIKDDEVIFDMVIPSNIYRSEKIDIYESYLFTTGEASILGSFDETTSGKSESGILLDNEKIPENYDLSLSREYDRLVVSGTFIPGDMVDVILYRNFKLNYYSMPVTKTPYAALCIDNYTDEEKEDGIVIKKYINDVGIKGNYTVFMKINDVIYSTGYKVRF